jgi:hypothetical protein
MNDTIDLFGVCEARICKLPERGITSEGDLVIVGSKKYHKSCAPTEEEQKAQNKSSV